MTTQIPAPTNHPTTPNGRPSARAQTGLDGQPTCGTQRCVAVEAKNSRPTTATAEPIIRASAGTTTSPQATIATTPIRLSPAGSKTGRGRTSTDAHRSDAPATDFPGDQSGGDAQRGGVAGDSDQPTAKVEPTPEDGTPSAASSPRAANHEPAPEDAAPLADQAGSPAPAKFFATPKYGSPGLADPLLALAADVLDDLEKVRIANENRFRQLTRDGEDKDGEERGFGLTADHPDVARLAALVDLLAQAEHQATLNLQRLMRRHPLGPWVKATAGVGEKQGARLLAAIGDPYWNDLHGRPRTVSELWAYCGYHVLPAGQAGPNSQSPGASGSKPGHPDQPMHDVHTVFVGVAAKRARGQRANWSATAKMRAFLIAESCIKARRSPFRAFYDAGREKYADAVHAAPCVRCGPKGKPAPVGSPLSAGHQHARALRLVAKELLKELWREAKRLHELPGDQARPDAHIGGVAGDQASPQAMDVMAPTGHTPAGTQTGGAR